MTATRSLKYVRTSYLALLDELVCCCAHRGVLFSEVMEPRSRSISPRSPARMPLYRERCPRPGGASRIFYVRDALGMADIRKGSAEDPRVLDVHSIRTTQTEGENLAHSQTGGASYCEGNRPDDRERRFNRLQARGPPSDECR